MLNEFVLILIIDFALVCDDAREMNFHDIRVSCCEINLIDMRFGLKRSFANFLEIKKIRYRVLI